MNILIYYYSDYRVKTLDYLSREISKDELRDALRDLHSRRRPRPCGLTVHTGIGCPYQCIYCYIYSMGFPRVIRRYPLSPYALAYAIASNKNIVLGRYGTFLALGSVTEPFHPVTKDYSMELIKVLHDILGNPVQVSTKAYIDQEDAKNLSRFDGLSILYTIVSIKWAKTIEPYAPPVEKRLESMGILSRYGIYVTLFLRPFIPGITEYEIDDILDRVSSTNIDRIVVGTLRVNKSILDSIRSHSRELYNLLKPYLPNRIDERQRAIKAAEIKRFIVKRAIEKGFKVYPSACSTSIDASKQRCSMCRFGPCGDGSYPPISDSDLVDFLEFMGYKKLDVSINEDDIVIYGRIDKNIIDYIKTVTRRDVKTVLR